MRDVYRVNSYKDGITGYGEPETPFEALNSNGFSPPVKDRHESPKRFVEAHPKKTLQTEVMHAEISKEPKTPDSENQGPPDHLTNAKSSLEKLGVALNFDNYKNYSMLYRLADFLYSVPVEGMALTKRAHPTKKLEFNGTRKECVAAVKKSSIGTEYSYMADYADSSLDSILSTLVFTQREGKVFTTEKKKASTQPKTVIKANKSLDCTTVDVSEGRIPPKVQLSFPGLH
jgi:hypothetical protein